MDALPFDVVLSALRAAGEPTRLRVLAVLSQGELTVGELCRVLKQTQPRVSRHLRRLVEAGLLDRHTQGTSAFFRPTRDPMGRRMLDAVLSLVDNEDPALVRDRERLAAIRAERAVEAAAYFERVAADWDRMRNLHVADAEVEAAMVDAVADMQVCDLLDVGTGTGRVLEVFAGRIDHGIGVDLSRQMLNLARSRLDQQGLGHCVVRQGDLYGLDLMAGCMDVAVLHHVLHFLDDPAGAVAEVVRTLRPGGRLVVVDFAPHDIERLRDEYAHHWLGFEESDVAAWCDEAGLVGVNARHLTPACESEETLTVTVWVATQRAVAATVPNMEAES